MEANGSAALKAPKTPGLQTFAPWPYQRRSLRYHTNTRPEHQLKHLSGYPPVNMRNT